MSESTLIASTAKLTRLQLAAVPTPLGTVTHRPVPHAEVVEALVETLSFRHIGVVAEEYAVSKDGMKMFGVLDLDTGTPGCRFSIGVRNSHDRSMRLAAVVGVRLWGAHHKRSYAELRIMRSTSAIVARAAIASLISCA